MRVLVSGANGLVGSRLCAALAGKGHAVVALGRGERRVEGDFAYLSCELSDPAAVTEALAMARPEVVINTASMTEVDACEGRPDLAYAANVTAPANLALASGEVGAHLVHVSTDYVFDGEGGPYDEDAVPNPRGVYAVTKHMGEQAVRTLCPSWAVARTAVVYGWPIAARNNFGAWLLQSLQKGAQVKLFEDQYVSPSFADSVAEMLAELGEKKLPGIWNVCGGEVVNRVAFGQALCRVFGLDPSVIVPVKLAELSLPSPRPLRSGLLTRKVQAALDVKPLELSESLARFRTAYGRARSAA
jgi:dTDP-4-dehydrorhamnose reductase